MTEKKSADEIFAVLRAAAKKDAAASYDAGFQAGRVSEGQPDKGQLQEQFNTRMASLKAGRNISPEKARSIQAEFMEAGLSWEDVDMTEPQPNWKGHRMGDGPPPSR